MQAGGRGRTRAPTAQRQQVGVALPPAGRLAVRQQVLGGK